MTSVCYKELVNQSSLPLKCEVTWTFQLPHLILYSYHWDMGYYK